MLGLLLHLMRASTTFWCSSTSAAFLRSSASSAFRHSSVCTRQCHLFSAFFTSNKVSGSSSLSTRQLLDQFQISPKLDMMVVDEEEEQTEKPWTLYNPGYFSNSDFQLRIVPCFDHTLAFKGSGLEGGYCHIPYDQPSQLWQYSPLLTPLETNSSLFLPRTHFQISGHVLGFPLVILHFSYPLLY